MLSVLIPVYRYDARPLVRKLVAELQSLAIDWEIRLYDDASPPDSCPIETSWLSNQKGKVVYRKLEKNLGRAAIRNLLARESRFDHLLFLDADGDPPENFIAAYLPYLNQGKVVNGGRFYSDSRSIFADQMLHWSYGTRRESQPASRRAKHPYHGFQTNNFLAPRELMLRHPFDEAAFGYGHEDTLWGWQLKALNVPIVHIDNAVEHLGLESHATFLRKQQTAVETLRLLEAKHPDLPSRLSAFASNLATLKPILLPVLALLAPLAYKRLNRINHGSLYWLDLLKLYWYWRE